MPDVLIRRVVHFHDDAHPTHGQPETPAPPPCSSAERYGDTGHHGYASTDAHNDSPTKKDVPHAG